MIVYFELMQIHYSDIYLFNTHQAWGLQINMLTFGFICQNAESNLNILYYAYITF